MNSNLTTDEFIKTLNSVLALSPSIDISNQNITDIKIEKYLLFYTPIYISPINLHLIKELHLDNNVLFCGFSKLFNILHLSSITYINLSNNQLDDKGAIVLASYLSNSNSTSNTNIFNTYLENLEYLDISKNYIGYEGAIAITNALKTHKYLNELNMYDNNIGSVGTNQIGEMLKVNESICSLNINDNNVNMYDCKPFATSVSLNTSLYYLDIGCNNFDEIGNNYIDNENEGENQIQNQNVHIKIENVIKLIFSSKTIKTLLCDSSDIDDIIVQYIANELKKNNILKELFLRVNLISNEGVYLLFDALKNNDFTVLKHISLANTYINSECISSFAELLGGNDVLQSVDMYDTDINNDALITLSKTPELKSNKSLIMLTFGQEDDIVEVEPLENDDINVRLNYNRNIFWNPYSHTIRLFNNEMHLCIISTLLCNYYGNMKNRLPMEVLVYIFKFFNRSKYLSY
jgi:Ran GTPase-activating protein (RanGAP) involved in mRNA processing and transport